MGFASDMRRIAAKTNIRAEELGRAVKIKTFNAVIDDTRVDTGRLKGNWQVSEDGPITGQSLLRTDKSGSAAKDDVAGTVEGISVSCLVNNLPYAAVWEEKDAMVGRNVVRIKRILAEAARETKR